MIAVVLMPVLFSFQGTARSLSRNEAHGRPKGTLSELLLGNFLVWQVTVCLFYEPEKWINPAAL